MLWVIGGAFIYLVVKWVIARFSFIDHATDTFRDFRGKKISIHKAADFLTSLTRYSKFQPSNILDLAYLMNIHRRQMMRSSPHSGNMSRWTGKSSLVSDLLYPYFSKSAILFHQTLSYC